MSPPEILVHAAAPSHASDDKRYRKEASEILHFQVARRHHVWPVPPDTCHEDDIARSSEQADQSPAPESITSDHPAPRDQLTELFTSWTTPAAARSSSKSFVGQTPATLLLPSTSAVEGRLLVERTPADQQRPRTAPTGPSIIQETPHLRRSHSDSFETPPSVIPDSQPMPATQQHEKKHVLDQSSSPSPTRQDPPEPKRRKEDDTSQEELEHDMTTATPPEDTSTPPIDRRGEPQAATSSPPITNPPHPPLPSPQPEKPPPPPRPPIPSYRKRTSHAPLPTTPTLNPTTHLTPTLTSLRAQCPTPALAVHPSRPLLNWERGYWIFTIPPHAWLPGQIEKFWSFMTQIIEDGRMGWNTSAVFEEGRSVEEIQGMDVPCEKRDREWVERMALEARREEEDRGDGWGRCKVFCWGEAVVEVWVVLWVGSGRGVGGLGAKWVDGGGEVVVEMKARRAGENVAGLL
ncbi:MAG: hypothetical protein Q9220_001721 [cf. Caloplaca sp. 1 TL-2023]